MVVIPVGLIFLQSIVINLLSVSESNLFGVLVSLNKPLLQDGTGVSTLIVGVAENLHGFAKEHVFILFVIYEGIDLSWNERSCLSFAFNLIGIFKFKQLVGCLTTHLS